MPFETTAKTDEIILATQEFAKHQSLIEAHALACKAVSDLFIRALRADNKPYKFDNVPPEPGYMNITLPNDSKHVYEVRLELVKKDHNIDLMYLKNAQNYDVLIKQFGKIMVYANTIFEILQKNVEKSYSEVMRWKLTVDESNSTMYIDKSHSKRVGFTIKKVKKPPVKNQPRPNPKKADSDDDVEDKLI